VAPWWWFPCKPKHVGAVLLILKYFNNSTFFNFVYIGWKLKCLILLMHGVTMKFRRNSLSKWSKVPPFLRISCLAASSLDDGACHEKISGLFTHKTQETSTSLPNTRLGQCPSEADSNERWYERLNYRFLIYGEYEYYCWRFRLGLA